MRRGLWDREMVALLLLLAMMPMTLAWLWFGGVEALGRLILTLLVSGLWHMIFMLARAQPPSFAGALTGVAVAMLAPQDLSLLQLILGISFGSVMAELVFGGWGRNVLKSGRRDARVSGLRFFRRALARFRAACRLGRAPRAGDGDRLRRHVSAPDLRRDRGSGDRVDRRRAAGPGLARRRDRAGTARVRPGRQRRDAVRRLAERRALRGAHRAVRHRLAGRRANACRGVGGATGLARRPASRRDRNRSLDRPQEKTPWLI